MSVFLIMFLPNASLLLTWRLTWRLLWLVTLAIALWVESLSVCLRIVALRGHLLLHSHTHVLHHRILLWRSVVVLLLLLLELILHCVLHACHHWIWLLHTSFKLLLSMSDHCIHDWVVRSLSLCFKLGHVLDNSLGFETNSFIV